MKHRRTKLSLGIKIASILSCVAILSAGFAAWWIVKTPAPVEKSGSFAIYEVTQKEITLSNVSGKNDILTNGQIIFGKPASPTATQRWLLAKDDNGTPMTNESLTANLDFVVGINSVNGTTTSKDSTTALNSLVSKITITLEPANETSKTNLNAAISDGYIKAPTIEKADGSSITLTEKQAYTVDKSKLIVEISAPTGTDNTMTVNALVKFGWGSVTNNDNPFNHYNDTSKNYDGAISKGSSTTYGQQAFALLEAVAKLKDAGYKITIDTTLAN